MTAYVTVEEDDAVPANPGAFQFDAEFQSKVAALQVRDPVFAQRTDGLIQPFYFVNESEAVLVKLTGEYFAKYKMLPDKVTLVRLIANGIANKTIRKDMVADVKEKVKELLTADISDRDFVVDEVASFAKHRALEEAILASVGDLDRGDFAKIAQRISAAQLVGVADDASGINYFDHIQERTERRKMIAAGLYKPDGITTGIKEIDDLLYHKGWGRKELSALMAPAKGGKSMGLADFGKYAAFAGFNVLYVSLEVASRIIADRLDANVSDTLMKGLNDNPFKVQEAVELAAKKSGQFYIHEFPTGTMKGSQLRRLIERYRARGVIFDLIIVDYADIMAAEHRNDNPIQESKSIWVDLRAIAFEQNAAVLTATQTNRDGAKATSVKATDVAEDFNKIRIADVVIAISATSEEKQVSEARIEFVAHRNGEEGVVIRIQQDRARMKFLSKVLGVSR
ncbi:replicative DNA helicase [Methylobacterium sp. PvP062]|uniref:Replicative DNA helicase n=1 Tax=Methylobacterium radiotolerans TaxID=31998 RepID=A0ABV2NUJ1_9HYPH|nr:MULTISPECIES: DnaB-like helicase C-terminal domain-containing protein [unclassified Methylobacterium]MBP2498429.1 replicative DNA helicase [Methylobacterium sp. PvP105]MBP2505608.1 replicative DNA helicase [Methylobacterium sp. PvP109]